MQYPFKWAREAERLDEPGQVIALEMDPQVVRPALSVQPQWNGCKGIVRGVKEADFVVEDFTSEEIRNGKLVDAGRRIMGADAMREHVWSIGEHKMALAAKRPGLNVLGWVGNGNLLSNPHFIGFADGTAFHLDSEADRFASRIYSSLVVRKTNEQPVSIEPLRYARSPMGTRVLDANAIDVTDNVECATFGQQLVRAGRPIERSMLKEMAVAGQFYDLRHLFLFGRIQTGNKRWLDAGLAAFWEESHLDAAALEQAIEGEPVSMDVRQFGAEAVRRAMGLKGYEEVTAPGRPGEYSLRNGRLYVVLLDGIYPHNLIGIREDGFLISAVLRGLSNRIGVSILGAADIMRNLGAQDALLLDNGADVMMELGGVQILGSANAERNRLKSVLFFTSRSRLSELRPHELRLHRHPMQYDSQ